jgi:hypothetical protein
LVKMVVKLQWPHTQVLEMTELRAEKSQLEPVLQVMCFPIRLGPPGLQGGA